ncbi:hypothetical protein ARALYDRAFT_315321 [Arabidopsis lyrata subsp. lyrata]|uniref:beta-glucosidase n=1 Tax=Arabidopsis lyrata subsp. lyrata TaxID=81972 RepID=D7KXC1_ARALL|nr:hypothetical protein ARALYDRAFT_315321 [Arabidopsis lyrata subsp. lyrata]
MEQIFALFTIFLAFAFSGRCSDDFSRYDFPDGFVFGAGTSAYQWEGAATEDGRKPSVWDTLCHSRNQGNGDMTCDGYHKYKEDVKLMVDTNLDAFRFSISWSRLIPSKILQEPHLRISNACKLTTGNEPYVTLYHYDHPQYLEDEYGGWLNRLMIKDFTAYADVCFREFGNHVKFWTTINEANVFSIGGYTDGLTPPGRCSIPGRNCLSGNSSTEQYIVGHNLLLAHASSSRIYKQKYKDMQGGFVGLSLYFLGLIPSTSSKDDYIATQRAKSFYTGWMLGPLIYGHYPDTMKRIVGSRLIRFHRSHTLSCGFCHKHQIQTFSVREPKFLLRHGLTKLFCICLNKYAVAPWAMEVVLEYIKQSYGNPPVYILENGLSLFSNLSLLILSESAHQFSCQCEQIGIPMKQDSQLKQKDTPRVEYLHAYIGGVLKSVRNGSDTRGYFVWSFVDLYEIFGGYEVGFGLYSVNFSDPHLKRSPKLSAHWYSDFLNGKTAFLGSQGIAELQSNLSLNSY